MKRDWFLLLGGWAIWAALLLGGCQKSESVRLPSGAAVVFSGTVRESQAIRTRLLDTMPVTSDAYNVDFYIQSCGVEPEPQYGTYVVPSGYEGRLYPKGIDDTLMWQDLRTPHTFYAWTLPWKPDYKPSDEHVIVTFEDSSAESKVGNDWSKSVNNAIMEKFIGAKSGTYSYVNHGKYVDLTFRHLVSKIKIGGLSLLMPDGAIIKDLQAEVTFVGMPTTATFYPHPDDNISGPHVEYATPDPNNGITYLIDNYYTVDNKLEWSDVFYICPEVNFRNIDFRVKLLDKLYADYDTYYGTFDDVKFERKGEDFDSPNGGDEAILHAGEMMTMEIVLIPGIGPGLSIIIENWNVEQRRESQYHTYPGLYSEAEVNDLLNTFRNQKGYYEDRKPQLTPEEKAAIERLFEIYGTKDEAGNKYFPLYENVAVNSNIFPIPEGYILDGQGHTITMTVNYGSNSDFAYSAYFNIGPVRDVYLTDGKNTIYIDKDGFVHIFDSEKGTYTKTNNQLTDLGPDKKSYDISCATGQVHQSTYYNNNITGS